MKEELLKQIVPIIEMTKEGIIKAAEIIQEQAPQVVAEIYKWEFLKGMGSLFVGLIILIISIFFVCRLIIWGSKDWSNRPEIMLVILLIMPICLGIALISEGSKCLQILIAPKLFLIEYLSNLIK